MQADSRFSNLAHVVVYSSIGVIFLLFGSNDAAPDWMPWLMLAAMIAGVGYCALGRRDARWKLVLWVMPGAIALLLLLLWFGVWITPWSSIGLGSRFKFVARPGAFVINENPPMGGTPVVRQVLGTGGVYDLWRRHVQYAYRGWFVTTPMTPQRQMLAGAAQVPQISATVLIPIWWPVGILGGPTLLWGVVVFVMWLRRRMRGESERFG
jgi:hypothetical protein